MRRWGRQVTGPGVTPGRTSLAETATLDAGLAQQLAVLLLRHTLAALLDHGAHTKCLSNQVGSGAACTIARPASDLDGGSDPAPPDRAARVGPRANRTSVPAGHGRAKTTPEVRQSARTLRADTHAPRARARGTNGRPGRP